MIKLDWFSWLMIAGMAIAGIMAAWKAFALMLEHRREHKAWEESKKRNLVWMQKEMGRLR